MRYMGSKNRLSKELVPIIQSYITEDINGYLEPFVGGANVIDKIKHNNKYACDINEYLIELLVKSQKDVSDFPSFLTEEDYHNVKNNMEKYEKWYVGLVGFMATFGNKFFGGVARNKTKTINDYYNESVKCLIKQASNLKDIIFECRSFETINPNISNFVIYCDPPYRGTTKYKTEEFPYEIFYDWCRKMAKNNVVLISEYNMPSDFKCIWSKEVKVQINSKRNKSDDKDNRIEKLFIINN
jgi:site-specific DNA-adenine methylase